MEIPFYLNSSDRAWGTLGKPVGLASLWAVAGAFLAPGPWYGLPRYLITLQHEISKTHALFTSIYRTSGRRRISVFLAELEGVGRSLKFNYWLQSVKSFTDPHMR